jgi:hypothetical protein
VNYAADHTNPLVSDADLAVASPIRVAIERRGLRDPRWYAFALDHNLAGAGHSEQDAIEDLRAAMHATLAAYRRTQTRYVRPSAPRSMQMRIEVSAWLAARLGRFLPSALLPWRRRLLLSLDPSAAGTDSPEDS